MQYDMIALGEVLMRFSPARYERLERAKKLDVYIVGSQMNVMADAASLGCRTAFVTMLPDSPLGDLAVNGINDYHVDTSLIRRVDGSRLGSTYVEYSAAPRTPRAVYDRKNTSASLIDGTTFDWDELARSARILHTDGIFPGLSKGTCEATRKFLEAGRRNGSKTSFDMNFRRHLWTPEEAGKCWSELLPLVDIVVINRGVCEEIFNMQGTDRELIDQFTARFGNKTIAFTSRTGEGMNHGSWNAILRLEDGRTAEAGTEFEIIDRYGSGDAWFAGLLTAMSRYTEPEKMLAYANAVIALAHTTFNDIIQVSSAEVEQLMAGGRIMLRR